MVLRGKNRDLTKSSDENPYINRKFNNKSTTQKRHQKFRLHKDYGHTLDGQFKYQQPSSHHRQRIFKV